MTTENRGDWVQIEKLTAGERLLRCAALMFFQRRDPICVHSLASSANQIFTDILIRLYGERPFDEDWIKPEHLSEWRHKKHEAANFFKHTDRDPQVTLSFNPSVNEHLLFEAVVHYFMITKPDTKARIPSAGIYLSAFSARNPELLKPGEWRDKAEDISYFARQADAFDHFAKIARKLDPGPDHSSDYGLSEGIRVPMTSRPELHDQQTVGREKP